MKKIERKAKFYNVLTKVLKYGGAALAVAGLLFLVGTAIAGASVAVVASGVAGLLGCSAFMMYPTAKVYADGYKAELELMKVKPEVQEAKIGDLIKEQTQKEIVYETKHEESYSYDDEITK